MGLGFRVQGSSENGSNVVNRDRPVESADQNRAGQARGLIALSDTVYLLISFKKFTPPQNCRLNILTSTSKE